MAGRRAMDADGTVGTIIRSVRETRGLTLAQVSELTGVGKGALSQIERGLISPTVRTVERIAEGLGFELQIRFKHLRS